MACWAEKRCIGTNDYHGLDTICFCVRSPYAKHNGREQQNGPLSPASCHHTLSPPLPTHPQTFGEPGTVVGAHKDPLALPRRDTSLIRGPDKSPKALPHCCESREEGPGCSWRQGWGTSGCGGAGRGCASLAEQCTLITMLIIH